MEHARNSSSDNPALALKPFYQCYPGEKASKEMKNSPEAMGRRHENLVAYVAIGFRRIDEVERLIVSQQDGLLAWEEDVIKRLVKTKAAQGRGNKANTMVAMFCYLIELSYQLCLSNRDNLSESPTFERFIQQFEKKSS